MMWKTAKVTILPLLLVQTCALFLVLQAASTTSTTRPAQIPPVPPKMSETFQGSGHMDYSTPIAWAPFQNCQFTEL